MSSAAVSQYHIEQKEELAALGAIYLEELEIVKTSPPFKFNINLRPYLDYNIALEDDDEELGQLMLKINFELTQNYPDEVPHFYVIPNLELVTQDHLCEIEKLVEKITQRISGYPMIFDICESIRAWVQENIIEDKYKAKQKANEKESEYWLPKRDTFTPVTVENFLAWKKKFDAEMKELTKAKLIESEENLRPSGRQIFERNRGLVADVAAEEEDGEDVDYSGIVSTTTS